MKHARVPVELYLYTGRCMFKNLAIRSCSFNWRLLYSQAYTSHAVLCFAFVSDLWPGG